jgi:Holliday junction resolvase RusA-like endonuclease
MPKAMDYHKKIQALRTLILPHREEIMQRMISGSYHIQFHFALPDSWSKKKKEEMLYKPHQQKPDNDNLFKSFCDTVFY